MRTTKEWTSLLANPNFYHFGEGHPQNLSNKRSFIPDLCDLLFEIDRLSISKKKWKDRADCISVPIK